MRPPPVPPMASGPPPGSLAAMQQAVSAAAAVAGGFPHLPGLAGHAGMGLPGTPLSALHAAARGQAVAAAAAAGLTHPPTSMANHMRRRMVDKVPPIPMSNGLPYMFDRAGLDIAQGKLIFIFQPYIKLLSLPICLCILNVFLYHLYKCLFFFLNRNPSK